MTLLIKAITHKWAFCISDRLLTQKASTGINSFDECSNKTIVYFPSDAMVSISYTGTAYIGSVPTDRWISEVLSGVDLPKGNDYKLTNTGIEWTNLYYSMENLVQKLNQKWPKLPDEQKKNDIGILICGWNKTRTKWNPVLWWLEGDGTNQSPFNIKRHKRFWTARQIVTVSSPYIPTKKERDRLWQSLLHERKNGTEKTAEKIIVNELRQRAMRKPAIGLDCMAVRMSWASNPQVIISYYPNQNISNPIMPKKSSIKNRTGMIVGFGDPKNIPISPPNIDVMGSYFAPWIVSKNMIVPPSSIVGSLTHQTGNISILVNGPPPPGGILGGFIAQSRPKKP